jgi:hypothetical protein
MKDSPFPSSRLRRRVDSDSQRRATGQHLHSFGSGHGRKSRKQGAHFVHLEGSESRIIKRPNVPTNPPAKYHIIENSSLTN